MRYRLAALTLFAMLSVMSLLIRPTPAPAILDIESPQKEMGLLTEPDPEPYGILDIGPPPKGKTAEQYRKDHIEGQTHPITLGMVCYRVRKLPFAPLANAHPWLAKNLRVTAEKGGRRLRFTFGAGSRAEQVAIINAFLRVAFSRQRDTKWSEEYLRHLEEVGKPLAAEFMRRERDPNQLKRMKREWESAKVAEAKLRAELDRLKQFVVVEWAK